MQNHRKSLPWQLSEELFLVVDQGFSALVGRFQSLLSLLKILCINSYLSHQEFTYPYRSDPKGNLLLLFHVQNCMTKCKINRPKGKGNQYSL